MCDEDDAVEAMDFDEELEFVDDALLFEVCLRVSGEASGPARERDAVVSREGEAVLEEVVEVFTDAAVGAVD